MRCLASDYLKSLKRTPVLTRPMRKRLVHHPLLGRVCAACPRGVGMGNGFKREIDLGFSQPLGILYRQALRSGVRVVNQILVIGVFLCHIDCSGASDSRQDFAQQTPRGKNKLGLHGCRAAPSVTQKRFECTSRRAAIRLAKTTMPNTT